ncbi:hypothetical protein Tco_0412832 [Tanacetum coccineum]
MELLQGATPICEGSCRLTFLERQEVWNDCMSCKVRISSNGNLLWEVSVLLGRKKGGMRNDTLKGLRLCLFGESMQPAGFHGVMTSKAKNAVLHELLQAKTTSVGKEMASVFNIADMRLCGFRLTILLVGISVSTDCDSGVSMDDYVTPISSYARTWYGGMLEVGLRGRSHLREVILVKVRWDSKRGPKLTLECKDQMRSKLSSVVVDSAKPRVVKISGCRFSNGGDTVNYNQDLSRKGLVSGLRLGRVSVYTIVQSMKV